MKKKKPLYSWLVMLFLLAISCSEDSADLKKVEEPRLYSLHNGRLIFKNPEDYVATINKLNALSEEDLQAWEKSLKGYKSWYSSKPNSEVESEAAVHLSPGIESLLNYKSVYQVGNTIV
jgi:hypothetical protein